MSLPYLAGSLTRLAPLGYYLEPGTELTGSVESAFGRGTGVRGTEGRSFVKKSEPRDWCFIEFEKMTSRINLVVCLVFFIMVAGVSSAPDASASTNTMKEFNVGRAGKSS